MSEAAAPPPEQQGPRPRNPFPGPRPYGAAERDVFFGREDMTLRLERHLLAHTCTALFGPSGSGKSSLMAAGVMPKLEKEHDYRIVKIDTWPVSEKPFARFVQELCRSLGLGVPSAAAQLDTLDRVMELAEQRSEQPILIYLDQLEQLLFTGRPGPELAELLAAVDLLSRRRTQDLHVVLALREDYLGRFRDRARQHRRLLENNFRLGPLTVHELTRAICKAATQGEPPRTWDADEVQALVMEMRAPGQPQSDDAEVQAAFAQIVARALWDEQGRSGAQSRGFGARHAEEILKQHLDATLASLGVVADAARRLLEKGLVTDEGHRKLLTEVEATRELPPGSAAEVLRTLERAAVLRAEEHQGSRYFELGHDWLASKVFELRKAREVAERANAEAERRHAAQKKRRLIGGLAGTASGLGLAVVLLVLLVIQWGKTRAEADAARTASRIAGVRELLAHDRTAMAAKLLLEVPDPQNVRGWTELALETLWSEIPLVTLRGHKNSVQHVDVSPDSRHVVTASHDGTARVWSIDGSRPSVLLRGHERRLNYTSFSGDGSHIVTSSLDGTVRVWNADGSGEPVVLEHDGKVSYAEFAPGGDRVRVAVASWDGTVTIWDIEPSGAAAEYASFEQPDFAPMVHFSPDGSRIVAACADGNVRVWKLEDIWEAPRVLRHGARVNSARFSPDGSRIITASNDRTARIWHVDGLDMPSATLGHDVAVEDARFGPEGRHIVSIAGRQAFLWHADDLGRPRPLAGHMNQIVAVSFSGDEELVVTSSFDGTARLWSVDDGSAVAVLRGHTGGLFSGVFSRDGRYVVTGSVDHTARVWRVNGWRRPRLLGGHTRPLSFAEFSPDGAMIVTAAYDKTARLWTNEGQRAPRVFKGHTDAVRSARFDRDGKRVVTASEDGMVRIWDVEGSREPEVVEIPGFNLRSAELGPDGKRLVITSLASTFAQIWSVPGGTTPLLKLEGHSDTVMYARFSPDGRRIVTASEDATACIWDAETGARIRCLEGHLSGVTYAEFSGDGRRVVTASADKTARVWNVDDGAQTRVFSGHDASVSTARFSKDGTQVVTAALDSTARVWNADGSGEAIILKAHNVARDSVSYVFSASFDPTGARVVTASSDHVARVWDIKDLQHVRRDLEEATRDCLAPELRVIHLGEDEAVARVGYERCERRLP